MSSRNAFPSCACFALALLLAALPLAYGQEKEPAQLPDVVTPIYVTTRIFQLSAKRDSYQEVNDQVFRLKTEALADEEKWLNAFKKIYPEFAPALLHTEARRVFRTSRPAVITFGQEGRRSLQIQMLGAQSVGDGVTPGTHLIPEIGLHFGSDATNPPLTFSLQPLEIESGMTYFFAVPRFKPSGQDYATFIRRGAPASAFSEDDHIFLFAFSVDLTQPPQTVRLFNQEQSAALLDEAQNKVQPELPAALKQAGLSGQVQVRVEIAPDGKVSRALTQRSTIPEMNRAAVAAARQWQFSPALFAENKMPISGLLTFEFAPSATKPPEQKQSK